MIYHGSLSAVTAGEAGCGKGLSVKNIPLRITEAGFLQARRQANSIKGSKAYLFGACHSSAYQTVHRGRQPASYCQWSPTLVIMFGNF